MSDNDPDTSNLIIGILHELRTDAMEFIYLLSMANNLIIQSISRTRPFSYLMKLFKRPSHGSKKNIVRQIGTMLPITPYNRVYFCIIEKFRKHDERPRSFTEEDFLFEESETIWTNNDYDFSVTRNDVSKNEIKNEINTKDFSTFVLSPCKEDSFYSCLRSSTPIVFESEMDKVESSRTSNHCVPDSVANSKIAVLEDELAKLRKQVADIVSAQENLVNRSTGSSNISTCNGNENMTNAIGPPAPPPPPPPPPPPLLPSSFGQPKLSIKDQIKLGKKSRSESDIIVNKKDSTPKTMDMNEVLKGLGSVKLKKVDRSPGGTPVRKNPLSVDRDDPASLIAAALKKRFSKIQMSPDKENYHKWSPDSSPSTHKFGQKFLKPSVIVRNSRLSPLKELNVR
ncbi:Mitochondrial fission regulator 2 [Nymphon striatum]|nr:Mitochondrial fission regulator 2 [Nymphon striatum]